MEEIGLAPLNDVQDVDMLGESNVNGLDMILYIYNSSLIEQNYYICP